MAENAQQDPQCSWFFTGVTVFWELKHILFYKTVLYNCKNILFHPTVSWELGCYAISGFCVWSGECARTVWFLQWPWWDFLCTPTLQLMKSERESRLWTILLLIELRFVLKYHIFHSFLFCSRFLSSLSHQAGRPGRPQIGKRPRSRDFHWLVSNYQLSWIVFKKENVQGVLKRLLVEIK